MNRHLHDILNRVVGLECIIIADRDGVPIMKASLDGVPETVLMSSFLSTFGVTSHQGSKVGMGENNTMICMYSSYQVVQTELQGMIVTFIGGKSCNTGHVLAITNDLNPLLSDIKKVLFSEVN